MKVEALERRLTYFVALSTAQTFFYIAWCLNTRAVVRGDYARAVWSDVVYNGLLVFVFTNIAAGKHPAWLTWLAMSVGGAAGTVAGMVLS